MRFTRRAAQDRGVTTADDVLQLGDTALPAKAELLLGAKIRLGRRGSQQPHGSIYGGANEYTAAGSAVEGTDGFQDINQSLLDNMLDPRGKLNVWPNMEQDLRRDKDEASPRVCPPTRPNMSLRKTSSHDMLTHYDAAREPTYVTQQTSASAIRDMRLHKALPPAMTIHESTSDPALARRPLKSALKKPTSPDMNHKVSHQSLKPLKSSPSGKRPRRLDLSHLFPPPRSSSRNALTAPNLQMPRSASSGTDDSDFPSPAETVHVVLRKPAERGRYETMKKEKALPEPVLPSRQKVFERDIYDSAKVNVRRPPKGIQNWFDGFDISSEEEDEEQVAPEQKVRISKVLPPAPRDSTRAGAKGMPVDFSSPWQLKEDREQPRLDRKLSKDPVEDNLLAIHHAKERIHERMRLNELRKGSIDSTAYDDQTLASGVSSEAFKRPAESRLGMVELASQSVLSLSESDEDGSPPSRGHHMDALSSRSAAESARPRDIPPKLQRQSSYHVEDPRRRSTSTVQTMQTSGSIPIRLTASIPLPAMPELEQSPPPAQSKRNTENSYQSPTAQALRQLTGQDQGSRHRRMTKTSMQEFGTLDSGASLSSAPTDGSHLMAVSEEEMILLELMRNKRAAMQQNSFSEGYQLALQREQDHLLRRRESAQQTVQKILRQREDKGKSRPGSRIAVAGPSSEQFVEWEQRRKLSALQKEEVDKALNMNKFFADVGSPTVDSFPEPPNRGQTPAPESKRLPQKFELLLPTTYSPTPSKARDAYSPVSAENDSPAPEFEDIEDHHESLRQFLASSSASEGLSAGVGAYLSQPVKSNNNVRRPHHVNTVLAPSPVAEEDVFEDEGLDDFNKYAAEHDGKERRDSINGRRVSRLSETDHDSDMGASALPSKMRHKSAMPEPLRQAMQPRPEYHLHPTFDFTPLEFSPTQITCSPSTAAGISPRTPSFSATASEKPTVEGGAYSSDNTSLRGRRAYTPDTDLTSLSGYGQGPTPTTTTSASSKKGLAGKRVKPQLDRLVSSGLQSRGSLASITSAGEDVLAAWAELGGGTEALGQRRRRR
ncbi:hypothetical protein LTR62_000028 [Meristemomyces frigidus]|uniref:Uncharacterized protein n=1 Tax=Meristemomyces frigidus TaxID=1508187 RepID=A0AAN7TRY5_9PEZI|nr:hypothetical protein LTR62_000028 [Meristemomyces frigidus]